MDMRVLRPEDYRRMPWKNGAGVTVEGRTFVGPEEAMERLRDLEGIIAGLSSRDLFELYDRYEDKRHSS